jgi:3-oxoacyl-(acyl-carrier-protein) synthase
MVANRVSYHLDLLGPSVPVDTACSSSQTAFHLAIQTLLLRDCKAAVVGGCQINHRYVLETIPYSMLTRAVKDNGMDQLQPVWGSLKGRQM